jgi:hypothetical protein
MTTVIDIRDARALRAMGAPLSTPVTEAKFSTKATTQIDLAYVAADAFRKRIDAFCENKHASGFHSMRRAHSKLARLIAKATDVPEAPEPEQVAVALFVGALTTCTAGWQNIFDQAYDAQDSGKAFTITAEMLGAVWPFNGAKIVSEWDAA